VAEVEWLRDLRGDITAGRLRLPLDALEHASIEPAALLADPISPALARLLDQRKARISAELRSIQSLLARDERSTQRQGLVLGELHEKLLERIDHRAEVARTRAEVPAWSRFWTAWRSAIRHA
jgi:phytoene/squalene synthetase